jgi:hypothetical protein
MNRISFLCFCVVLAPKPEELSCQPCGTVACHRLRLLRPLAVGAASISFRGGEGELQNLPAIRCQVAYDCFCWCAYKRQCLNRSAETTPPSVPALMLHICSRGQPTRVVVEPGDWARDNTPRRKQEVLGTANHEP